jgi:hypothetical protein
VRWGCVTVEVDTEEDMVSNVGGCVVGKQSRSNSNCKLLCGVQDGEMTAGSQVERFEPPHLAQTPWPFIFWTLLCDLRLHNRRGKARARTIGRDFSNSWVTGCGEK